MSAIIIHVPVITDSNLIAHVVSIHMGKEVTFNIRGAIVNTFLTN